MDLQKFKGVFQKMFSEKDEHVIESFAELNSKEYEWGFLKIVSKLDNLANSELNPEKVSLKEMSAINAIEDNRYSFWIENYGNNKVVAASEFVVEKLKVAGFDVELDRPTKINYRGESIGVQQFHIDIPDPEDDPRFYKKLSRTLELFNEKFNGPSKEIAVDNMLNTLDKFRNQENTVSKSHKPR